MKLQTPRGAKDFLPDDARWKYVLEQKIHELFAQWGYQVVITPTFEFFDVFAQGDASTQQIYRFLDRRGEMLALRSDITTPIARMVTTRLKGESKPLRLAYLANVFRYDTVQVGFQREFYQAGIELIGSSSPLTDAEVAAFIVTLFNSFGIENFSLDIGQIQYIHGVIAECECDSTKKLILNNMLKKDMVGLKDVVENSKLSSKTKKLLLELPNLRGKMDVLDYAYHKTDNEQAQAAVNNLKEIYTRLQAYDIIDQINIDFSIVKSLNYYTGMVLEGYVSDLGFTLCSGGRYDNLSRQFGSQLPAVGFALGLERLMLVLEKLGLKYSKQSEGRLVIPHSWSKAVAYAAEKRREGIRVIIDTQGLSEQEAINYAKSKGLAAVVIIGRDTSKMIRVRGM